MQQYNYPIVHSSQLNPQQRDSIAHSGLNEDQTKAKRKSQCNSQVLNC